MNLPDWHNHISERESDGTWEDCTWDSGLEWYRLCYDKSKPATHAEAQALRAASGEPSTGGSNIGDLRRGIAARYGRTVPAGISGFTNLWNALKPGYAATVQGSMVAFGPSHRLSRFDPNFDGGHAVCVLRLDAQDRVWWCDPEAPDTGYNGEWVTKAELAKYVNAFGGQHVVAPILVAQEETVDLKTYTPGYTASVKVGSNVRSAPRIASTKYHSAIATALPVGVIGTVAGDVDPANGSNVWYALWHDGRVEYTAKDNIVNLKAPAAVDDGFTKATQEAAVAAAVANAQLAIDAAVKAERERIADVEAARIKAL